MELKVNNIYNGDCLELMKYIPSKSVDMILCDLPYGTTHNKWDSIIPFELLWKQYNRLIKDNGAIVLFAQNPFDKKLGYSNLKMLRYEWIWRKKAATGFLNSKKAPLKSHENILVFYKKQPTYNPQGIIKLEKHKKSQQKTQSSNYGTYDKEPVKEYYNYPKDILEFSSQSGECANSKRLHPTQKPIALLEYLIKTYTIEGQTVLDNCFGSGSTIIAAINTNRQYIGIEKDENYFNIASKRIQEHLSKRSDALDLFR